MLTQKNSTIISFRIEKRDWEKFKQKCRQSNRNAFELIRKNIIKEPENFNETKLPVIDNLRYSYDSYNKTIRFEGKNKVSNRSHILAEYPTSFLQTLLEDNINLAKNLIDIRNKHLIKNKKKFEK